MTHLKVFEEFDEELPVFNVVLLNDGVDGDEQSCPECTWSLRRVTCSRKSATISDRHGITKMITKNQKTCT